MKVIATLILCFFLVTSTKAQDFPGFRTANYGGVNSVFFNPANVADSRYKFDINLFSVSTFVGNNQASFNLKDVIRSGNTDSISKQFLGNGSGLSTGMVNVDFHGPSVQFNLGAKRSLALTTRARLLANVIDVDGALINQVSDDADADIQFPYTINSASNMRMAVNGWTEFGLTYGQIIKNEGKHFFKGGVTLKYLRGVGNGYINIDNFKGTLTQDILQNGYLTNSTGRISAGFGGVNVSDIEPEDLTKSNGNGIGADIGFVYEWRPEAEKYKTENGGDMRNRNKYKLKVGLALLDIGKIKYTKDAPRSGSYDINITGNERLDFNDLSDLGIDEFNTYFKSRPAFFTPATDNGDADYNVALPSTLQLDVDYNLHNNLYMSLATQLPLTGNGTKAYNGRYYSSVSLTPRYEGKGIGLYVPLTYNSLTKFNAGTSLRLGSFFFGSGSVLTALFGNSKQADFFIGFHIGFLQKKKEDKKSDK